MWSVRYIISLKLKNKVDRQPQVRYKCINIVNWVFPKLKLTKIYLIERNVKNIDK